MYNAESIDRVLKNKKPAKLFTLKEGIPEKFISLLLKHGHAFYEWTDDPATADYLAFPVNYEVAHDPEFFKYGYFEANPDEKALILKYEAEIMRLSQLLNKKIIVIFYNDSAAELEIDNAIIFRTSIVKSYNRPDEYSVPVLNNNLVPLRNDYPEFVNWTERPKIGFRGQAAPEKLKASRHLRNHLNLLANRFNKEDIFNLKKNFGYLERRNALIFLKNSKIVECDFGVTGDFDTNDSQSQRTFAANMFNNAYTLCVSGFGNYSYRFFEALSAGRIPLFVNTDCKLPFEEFIDWNEYVVWVDRKEIPRIDKILLDYHRSKKGDAFIRQQQKNRDLWDGYLAPDKFYKKISIYL